MKRLRTEVIAAGILIAVAPAAMAASTPQILTSKANKVPACVTPAHLMAFTQKRNTKLPAKLAGIAAAYKLHGEELHVRWDYAFFQMLVETNYLKFYAPNGGPGDVSPGQNNFAGLGATGHRAPGESFASVDLGVQAHLGHVRLYSGDPLENPVAQRTKLVTDLILPWAQSLKRPVTFTDLTRKWAPSGHSYSDAIEGTAENYRKAYCNGAPIPDETASADAPEAVATEVAAQDETVAAPAKPVAKVKVAALTVPAIKSPVIEVAAEPVTEPAAPVAKEVAAASEPVAPAADDEVVLAGPALKKAAKKVAEPVTVADAESDGAAQLAAEAPAKLAKTTTEAVDTPDAAAAEPVAKPAVKLAAKLAAKAKPVKIVMASADAETVVESTKTAPVKLPVTATITAPATPSTELEASVAKLDGLDTSTDLAADQAPPAVSAETATSDEGDGGATEVTQPKAPATVAAATVKKALVAASSAEAPAVKVKAPVKPAVVAEPANDVGEVTVTTQSSVEDAASNTQLASLTVPANPAPSKNCKVFTASYGGGMSLLIQSPDGERTRFTALTVNEAKSDAQAKAFINVYAKGGQKIASFGTQNEALTKAFQLCPEG